MAKEDVGKAVLYNPYPFAQGDVSFVADYARRVIRAVTGQDAQHVSSDKYSHEPGVAYIHLFVEELMKETFNKEAGHIKAIRTVTLKLLRLRGFSSYEKSVECKKVKHNPAYWDKEGYSLWVFTDGLQKDYRCKRWHSYAPREHFFYDTQVCGEDMLCAVERSILQVFMDKGFKMTSVIVERLASARAWQKDERRLYVLGGTEHGDIEK